MFIFVCMDALMCAQRIRFIILCVKLLKIRVLFLLFSDSTPSYSSHGGLVVQSLSLVRLLQPHGLQPVRLLCPWDSPGKNTGVGCHFLFQGIFPTQELNLGLLHCRQSNANPRIRLSKTSTSTTVHMKLIAQEKCALSRFFTQSITFVFFLLIIFLQIQFFPLCFSNLELLCLIFSILMVFEASSLDMSKIAVIPVRNFHQF